MIATESYSLRHQILTVLRDEYQLGYQREGLHVSDLIYCLTKAYWRRVEPEPPTEQEIGLWSIGWSLERVIIPRLHVAPMEVDGITGSIDFAFPDGTPADLKTTRMAPGANAGCLICGEPFRGHNKDALGHGYEKSPALPFQFPEGWLRQFKSYRYMANQQGQPAHAFGVAIVHLIQADIKVWELSFSDQELEENWQWMLARANYLESMNAADDPQPFQHRAWESECDGCAFSLKCQLAGSLRR